MSETIRPRRSRDEWRRLVEEQACSGQTQAAFCASRALSVTSLQYWKRRLAATPPRPAWLDLGRLDERGSAPSGWEIELDLGQGVCLRLRRC